MPHITKHSGFSFQLLLLLLTLSITGCSSSPSVEPAPETVQTTQVENKASVIDDDLFEDDDLFAEDDDPFADEEDDLLADDSAVLESEDSDPLYYFNKAMFHVNDKLYFWVLKPTATAYKAVTPQFFRTGVSNFFHNIAMPVRLVNNLLQGNMKGSGTELGRFAVNTTVGVFGLMDPAKDYLDWQPYEQDLGITLGKYGIGNGPYIVWPFFGPSTLRDTVGLSGDYFLGFSYYVDSEKTVYAANGLKIVNKTSGMLGDYEAFKQAYIDPYERMKEFYLISRQEKVDE